MPNVGHRLIPHEHEEARGWTIRRVASKAPVHRAKKDEFRFQDIGDARNPDLVGLRFDAVNAIASADLETLAVEVKKSFDEFGKRTIAQAQSYLEFANIVYMAVYADGSALLQKKVLINLISRLGIGLIARKDGKNHWTEVIQPRYNFVRGSLKSYFLEHFFPGETMKIRGMIASAVQETEARMEDSGS